MCDITSAETKDVDATIIELWQGWGMTQEGEQEGMDSEDKTEHKQSRTNAHNSSGDKRTARTTLRSKGTNERGTVMLDRVRVYRAQNALRNAPLSKHILTAVGPRALVVALNSYAAPPASQRASERASTNNKSMHMLACRQATAAAPVRRIICSRRCTT